MKYLLSWKVVAGLALLILWAWPAVAQTHTLRVDVPFPFTAANQSLPAGQYLFTLHSERPLGFLTAANTSDGCIVSLAGYVRRSGGSLEKGMLRFAKYGSRYVLTGIWQPGQAEGQAVAGSRPPNDYSKGASPVETVELR
jgi:hypothetical protein